jgi:hypothetical protein
MKLVRPVKANFGDPDGELGIAGMISGHILIVLAVSDSREQTEKGIR